MRVIAIVAAALITLATYLFLCAAYIHGAKAKALMREIAAQAPLYKGVNAQ